MDTAKVRIQTQPPPQSSEGGGKKLYSSTLHCIRNIVNKEGATALYRGMSSPLVGVAAINAVTFGVHGNVSRSLANPDSMKSQVIAGLTAGLAQSFLNSPMELVKTRMQVPDGGTLRPMETIRKIYKKGGARGFSRGLGMTIARDVPGCGVYFISYEMLVRGREDNVPVLFVAGGIAGMLSWAVTYPQDVIKSRMQADANGKYKGAVHCLKASLAAEGGIVLWRGLGSALIRAFPVNAVTFGVYRMLSNHFRESDSGIDMDAVKRKRSCIEPTYSMEGDILGQLSPRTGTVAETLGNRNRRQTPTAMVPMLYAEERSAKRKEIREYEMSESEPAVMVGTIRNPVPMSAVLRFLESRLIPALDWICHYRAAMEMRVHGSITLQM